jgi:hypothetical protein
LVVGKQLKEGMWVAYTLKRLKEIEKIGVD